MKDMILILNYSEEFSLEAARRLRAEHVYSRIISGMTTAAQVEEIRPKGIILCGAAGNAPGVFDAGILDLGIPVLALGHASHMLLAAQGGASAGVAIAEKKANIQYEKSDLFAGIEDGERYLKEVMTLMLPLDVQMIASAGGCTIAFEQPEKKQYGLQFELERNDPEGTEILKNFARDICECTAWWTQDAYRREGESQRIQDMFGAMGIPLRSMDCSAQVLDALKGKQRMQEKRSVVLKLLHDEVLRQTAVCGGHACLVLGTNYSDIWSGGAQDEWRQDGLTVEEPLQSLFKDEVRDMARQMGFDEELASRKPFPALGLGARIIGEVTQERLDTLRIAERVFHNEIQEAGFERKLYKYFPILVGDMGAMGGEMIILRAVTLSGAMLIPARLPHDLVERTVERIREEAPHIVRVFYDQTPTPVGQETFA